MPRLDYLPHDIAEPADVVSEMRAKRPGGRLLEIDRIILHAPEFARAWTALAGASRLKSGLPPKLRELAILGVGVLKGGKLTIEYHSPAFLDAGGTEAQLRTLLEDYEKAARNAEWFTAAERAVMRLAIEMTREVKVSDATFGEVRAVLPDPEKLVAMVGAIALYNMASHFLLALKIKEE